MTEGLIEPRRPELTICAHTESAVIEGPAL